MGRQSRGVYADLLVSRDKVLRQLFRTRKALTHWFTQPVRQLGRTTVLIMGCQRSGTTMMTRIFEWDINTKVFAETSRLSSQDRLHGLRLNPLPDVQRVIARQRAPLVILKPLVESQNTPELLDFFVNSKAIWLYRHYKDVAASYVAKWGEGHSARDLRVIVDPDQHDWRDERVPAEVVQIVREHYSESMNSYDASALYWYVRNRHFYARQLENDPRVMLCQYEQFVKTPVEMLRAIYGFIDHPFPGDRIVGMVRDTSIAKGRSIPLSPSIDALCRELQAQLDHTFQESLPRYAAMNSPLQSITSPRPPARAAGPVLESLATERAHHDA